MDDLIVNASQYSDSTFFSEHVTAGGRGRSLPHIADEAGLIPTSHLTLPFPCFEGENVVNEKKN